MAKNNIRRLYARMSAKFRYDIKRLKGRQETSQTIERYEGEFPSLTRLGDYADDDMLKLAIERMKEARAGGQLSLRSKIRAKANFVQHLHEEGFDFIDMKNVDSLLKFLDDARAKGLATYHSSEPVMSILAKGVKKGLTSDQIMGNIAYWAEHPEIKVHRWSKKRGSSDKDFRS